MVRNTHRNVLKIKMVRSDYYSQTEACKLFKITPKRFKELVDGLDVKGKEITLHTSPEGQPFNLKPIYVLKSDFYKLIK